jgi:hypothetical protein
VDTTMKKKELLDEKGNLSRNGTKFEEVRVDGEE